MNLSLQFESNEFLDFLTYLYRWGEVWLLLQVINFRTQRNVDFIVKIIIDGKMSDVEVFRAISLSKFFSKNRLSKKII